MGRVTRLGGLPGLPGRVTLSAGVTICPADIFNYSNYFYRINFFYFWFFFLIVFCFLSYIIYMSLWLGYTGQPYPTHCH